MELHCPIPHGLRGLTCEIELILGCCVVRVSQLEEQSQERMNTYDGKGFTRLATEEVLARLPVAVCMPERLETHNRPVHQAGCLLTSTKFGAEGLEDS